MKFYKFILLLVIFHSCKKAEFGEQKNQLEIYYSDLFKEADSIGNLKVIDLDNYKSFSDLTDRMSKILCQKNISGLRFDYNNVSYNLTGFVDCPNSRDISCYFRVHHIYVQNDSLYTKIGKDKVLEPIEELGNYLDELIQKPFSFKDNNKEVKTAIITLNIDDDYPIDMCKKVLSRIYMEFKKIENINGKDFFKYHILYKGHNFVKYPPPPPPPKPITLTE